MGSLQPEELRGGLAQHELQKAAPHLPETSVAEARGVLTIGIGRLRMRSPLVSFCNTKTVCNTKTGSTHSEKISSHVIQ